MRSNEGSLDKDIDDINDVLVVIREESESEEV
jgi:hypothetical protein